MPKYVQLGLNQVSLEGANDMSSQGPLSPECKPFYEQEYYLQPQLVPSNLQRTLLKSLSMALTEFDPDIPLN